MAKPVDEDAVRNSEKVLTVMFILAILAANAFLVVKLLRRAGSRLLQLPQLYVLAALVIGDILLALFSLAVRARGAYEKHFDPSCSTMVLANDYPFFNAFVFCVGLIIIVMGTFLPRNLGPNTLVVTSLASGGLPYLMGLIIVLPLAVAGLDWNKCEFVSVPSDRLRGRLRAVGALSYIVLPILALITSVVVIIYKRRGLENNDAQPLDQSTSPGFVVFDSNSVLPASVITPQKSLVFISIVTIILYAPLGLFLLSYMYNLDRSNLDPIPEVAITLALTWFSFLRPVLVPVFFALMFNIPDSA